MITPTNCIIPHKRAWVAAYVHGKQEAIEIRTESKDPTSPYVVLHHYDYPIGSLLADFVYAELTPDEKQFGVLDRAYSVLNALNDRPSDEDGYMLSRTVENLQVECVSLLRKCGMFAPVVAALEGLCADYAEKETEQGMSAVQSCLDELFSAQSFVKDIAQRFLDVNAAEDMTARYFRFQSEYGSALFPTPEFGFVRYENAALGARLGYPFNRRSMAESLIVHETCYTEVLNTNSVKELVHFLLMRYMQENLRFQSCKYCGKFFGIVGNYKQEYCERKITGTNKTCRDTGSLRLYEQRIYEKPAMKEYKRSYKAHNARIRYGLMTREEFSAWSLEARQKRDACIAGELSFEDFVAWLDSDKLS